MEVDPEFSIVPRKDSEKANFTMITSPNHIKNHMKHLQVYLPKIRHLPQGGYIYTPIQVTHESVLASTTYYLGYFLQSQGHGMWECSIEVE